MLIINGDCIEEMRKLDDNSVDSIVTDPPYELGFMGKSWDSTGIANDVSMWREALRVLKPGGHLISFSGTRTYHRMASAIEDAGFEVRDMMQWLFGSGMPKSHDISKAIDKKLGKTREVIGQYRYPDGKPRVSHEQHKGTSFMSGGKAGKPIEAPASDEAKQWSGWGTALKPACEIMCLARKPLSEKTVADNVMRWGTGGINIDDSRIGTDELKPCKAKGTNGNSEIYGSYNTNAIYTPNQQGRFPANVLLDETAAAILDKQSGTSKSTQHTGHRTGKSAGILGEFTGQDNVTMGHNDSGGASRFFYVAKASKRERGEGNVHPTVKPLKLMEYLVTLITPPNGTVLDPFMGSGTTGIAAKSKGFDFVGIEQNNDYCEIARRRIG